ncbi:hypothetical protein [Demequina mangrovi]|uniref:ABC-type transport system involved in cytochrome c biogenesis, permease component n=1 Tax=Demequina mangrovi TaxID=1043493 RepID=A0A1H6W604_9MICO|nr:hypothetical protein [Demequina mangrovi]SEJ10654.1 ABC-type transport system involved in cytochrome c biogenesis, permease component [Demequina mangrovi]
MTVLDDTPAAAPAPEPAPASSRGEVRGNPWFPTLRGTLLVTQIELMRRRPTAKGWIFYGLVLTAIIGVGVLLMVFAPEEKNSIPMELILVMVLGTGMLIAPSLSATSINGDSSEGVLAPLQMTRLRAGDLAMGKLLASWCIALVVLLTATPFLVYAFSRSGWHWDELLIVLGGILLVVLTSTAIGLAWSSIAARAVASVSLAHLTTGALLLGTLLVFLFTQPLISETVTSSNRYIDWGLLTDEQAQALDQAYMTGDFTALDLESLTCIDNTYEYGIAHTERTAWLLLANPVVMIGEMSPIILPSEENWGDGGTVAEEPVEPAEDDGRAEPGMFATMHAGVSDARIGPSEAELTGDSYDECADLAVMAAGEDPYAGVDDQWQSDWEAERQENAAYDRAPWIGLGVQAVLLLGSLWIVIARLRVPYKKLRQGTRVA